jgi:hypothetical protein
MIMIGSGAIGNQPLLPITDLPASQVLVTQKPANGTGEAVVVASAVPSTSAKKGGASARYSQSTSTLFGATAAFVLLAGMMSLA